MSRVTPSSGTIRWPHRRAAARLLASIVVSCIVIVPAAVRVHAGPALPLATYAHRAWTTSQGLPQNAVHAVWQTRDGYLWIGTGNGLVRFDGLAFVTFDVTTTPALPTNWISALHEDATETLWIGTDAGLLSSRDGVFTHDPLAQDRDHWLVSGLVVDDAGRVWVSTRRQVLRRDGDRDGVLWIGGTNGLFSRSPDGRFTAHPLGDGEAIVVAIAQDRQGLSPSRVEVVAREDGLPCDNVASVTGATLALAPRVHQRRSVQLAALIGAIAAPFAVFRLVAARSRERARRLETLVAERTVELQRERDALAGANQELVRTNEQLNAARLTAEASHIHLLAMLDQLGIGVIVVDLQEQVRFASQVTRRLIAAPEGDAVVGRRLHEVLPIPPATLAELRTALLTPRPGARITAKLQPSAGQRYWTEIEARVDPRDKDHRVLYLYDVTEAYDVEPLPPVDRRGAGAALVGASPAMRIVRAQIATAAGVDATVLIEGQTGTGKELVARAIHEASRRRARPFVAINCAGLTESLLASQLFGHTRGAFTGAIADQIGLFEAAQGGTLLLDEIGDMPMSMQSHLLRVLQEREIVRVGEARARPIDVRVLAATHRSLDEEVIAGRFREDLLYRIRVVRIELPALRQRTEDIPQLSYAFLAQFAASHGRQLDSIAREAMERLIGLRWQGNVRELRSVIEWAVIHARGPVIKLSDLPREIATDGAPPPRPRPTVPDAERQLLIGTLQRTQGNRSMAARLLGVSRATLYRRLAELDAGDAAGADAPVGATAGASGGTSGDATGARQQPPIAGDPS